jgi:hypothetical protein
MKLGYFCNTEINKHEQCGGQWVENPDTNDEKNVRCSCWCHKDPEQRKLLVNEQVPKFLYGSGI